jgi:hypothetical protein
MRLQWKLLGVLHLGPYRAAGRLELESDAVLEGGGRKGGRGTDHLNPSSWSGAPNSLTNCFSRFVFGAFFLNISPHLNSVCNSGFFLIYVTILLHYKKMRKTCP